MVEEKDIFITTLDNPFDYFTQSRNWTWWDESHGYGTLGLVARLAHTSDNLSDMENDSRINHALFDILEHIGVASSGMKDDKGEPLYTSQYVLTTPKDSRVY